MVLGLYAGLTGIVLVAAPFSSSLAWVLPWFAIPLLAEAAWLSTPEPHSGYVRTVCAALLVTAGADVLSGVLSHFTPLSAGYGFLVSTLATLMWVATLWPVRRVLRARHGLAISYVLVALAGYYGTAQTADGLQLVVVVCNLVLAALVGVLSAGLPQPGVWAGALYMLWQFLAAMAAYAPGWDRPGMLFWIQAAHLSGMYLLSVAALRESSPSDVSTVRNIGQTM